MQSGFVYIIDIFDKYSPKSVQEQVCYKFTVNDIPYAIYKVGFEWGQMQMERPLEEEQLPNFHYFNTYAAAYAFAQRMRRINN